MRLGQPRLGCSTPATQTQTFSRHGDLQMALDGSLAAKVAAPPASYRLSLAVS